MRFWPSIRPPRPALADHLYDRYDAYTKLLDRNARWIEVADAKAGVALALLVAVFPTLMSPALSAAKEFVRGVPRHADFWQHVPTALYLTLLIAFGLTALYTLACVLLTLVPRTTRNVGGLIFFGDIAAHDRTDWQQKMLALDPHSLVEHVLEQTHVTAGIAAMKHTYARLALRGVFLSVVLGLVAYVIAQLAG